MPTSPPTSLHDAAYDRKRSMQAYARRAYPLYRQSHVQRAMAMVLKAIGLQPQGWLNGLLTRVGLWFLRRNAAKLAEPGRVERASSRSTRSANSFSTAS